MDAVQRFEERSEETGRQSMGKDVRKYTSEFGLTVVSVSLTLDH